MIEWHEKLTKGGVCPLCAKGTLKQILRGPVLGMPGMSEVQFRCSACNTVVRQIEDDRFRD